MAVDLGMEYGTPVREGPKPMVLYDQDGEVHDLLTDGLNAGFYQIVSDGSDVYVRVGKDGDIGFGMKKITIKATSATGYDVTGQYYIGGWGIGDTAWDPAENSDLVIGSGDAQRAVVFEPNELLSYTPFQLKISPTGPTTFYVQILEG